MREPCARNNGLRYWTPEKIVAAIRAFDDLIGRPPSCGDVHFRTPTWSARMTPARLAEAQRAWDNGIELPSLTAVRREFGGWTAAINAAGFETNSPGNRAERRVSVITCNREVCPCCGDFVWHVDEVTGWCVGCARDLRRAAA